MTSNRHKRIDHDAVLDAARDSVLDVGVRRTTLTDVARRAGVSRMTLYRRWPDVRTLVGDLMTREWIALATSVTPPGDGRPAREAMVESLVTGARAFREHPLMRKIIDVDPELLLTYLLDRCGASQQRFLEFFEAGLRAGHEDGTIRPGHPARQARAVLLVVQAFTLSLRTMTSDSDPDLGTAAFDEELRHLLDRALAP
ncbi:TetR/AcrR family transcriptional regulator [Actinomadura alba]|uniref:TetR/AcrR family transcriptional regulator n=1 Tax=Actinomadura alba TaxID=406431 RepID=A0ABR7LZN1_9ACTN|nr:TetR/AcrR family transcriptional regulator [Actinomadura alba]MBC6470303.1 TetR/AcrR family transcriptional regulator [Actinomadura alba]